MEYYALLTLFVTFADSWPSGSRVRQLLQFYEKSKSAKSAKEGHFEVKNRPKTVQKCQKNHPCLLESSVARKSDHTLIIFAILPEKCVF